VDLKSNHVLIAGTGRAGTSFLMQLLTSLGFDTGFDNTKLEDSCNAGLEDQIDNINYWHYVVKNPRFSCLIGEIQNKVDIDHIIIPVRQNDHVSKSREKNGKKNGGFWLASSYEGQKIANANVLTYLVEDLSKYDIPHTFIWFDNMITDGDYLYNKLCDAFDIDMDYALFHKKYNELIDLDKVNF
jgi:hypothetical protein